jgi:hypothetical protein
MFMRLCLVSAILGLAFLGCNGAEPVAQLAEKKGWLTDYQAARAAARKAGKPLMVVFRCQP